QDGLYWFRPYPLYLWLPAIAAVKGDYIWTRTSDHAGTGAYIGYSNSPEVKPSTWAAIDMDIDLVTYQIPETMSLVWNPDTGKIHMYWQSDCKTFHNPPCQH